MESSGGEWNGEDSAGYVYGEFRWRGEGLGRINCRPLTAATLNPLLGDQPMGLTAVRQG